MLNPKAIPLNTGLDTVTPAIMKEGGALIDCLNYEMTGTHGYRRIDGFESYDGWVNGDIATYYRTTVNITDGTITASLVPGALLTAVDTISGASIVIGIIVAYSAGTLTYVSVNPDYLMVPNGTAMDTTITTSTRMQTTSTAVNGMNVDSATTFVTNLRAYSTALRAMVTTFSTNVAGIYWFRNSAVAALDTPVLTYTDAVTNALAIEGTLVAFGGTTYLIVNKNYNAGTTLVTLHLQPVSTNALTPANVYILGHTSTTLIAAGAPILSTAGSDWAYLVALYNPETSTARGQQVLRRSYILRFTGGLVAAEALFVSGSLISVGTSAAQYNNVYVNNMVLTGGTFATNNATGYIEVVYDTNLGFAGDINYASISQDLNTFGGGTKLADIDYVSLSKIAGTKRLRNRKSHYQWGTYNFYGQEDTTRIYGATGASRAFWANAYVNPLTNPPPAGAIAASDSIAYAWGNILTDLINPDNTAYPKYLTLHSRVQLALGFRGGSVLFSVIGEPLNYNGTNGALEVATGDDITGLLEGASDSTIVFGRRSIRHVTGNTDTDLAVETISGNAGAMDYTCVLVGPSPVFTNSSGVTTLEQTEKYGDFLGLRSSYKVSSSLPVQLVTDRSDSETGGVAMAMPVRAKDQYRLFLKSGKVISVAFTGDGSKIMESNYGSKFTGQYDIRVPFAWSSAVADGGKEMIFVVWDDILARRMQNVAGNLTDTTVPNPRIIYAMDRGWGFDGVRMPYKVDVAHQFQNGGTAYTGISKTRVYGKGYGLANLNIKAAGIEQSSFDIDYHNRIQDLSMPRNLTLFTPAMRDITDIVDTANRGLGIKLGFYATELTSTQTEPSHVLQVLVCDMTEGGLPDG